MTIPIEILNDWLQEKHIPLTPYECITDDGELTTRLCGGDWPHVREQT